MIEPASGPSTADTPLRALTSRKVFRMEPSERMAGSVPVWETPHRAQQRSEQILTAAATGDDTRAASFAQALAYQNPGSGQAGEALQEFGFGDLVDMVNPLQHIPVVGHLYRQATGDTIKPISQIMGGAVFGGPVGAVAGLINTIVHEETGKDITGNVLAAAEGENLQWKSEPSSVEAAEAARTAVGEQSPEARLSLAARELERAAYNDLPPALMGFADLKPAAPAERPGVTSRDWRKREHYND